MQKIIRHKNHNDRGIVSTRHVLATLHHFPRRVCGDCSEFLNRQLSLHLRVDAMIVRNVAGVIGDPFSTHDMASLLGAEEYQVRAAIGWLIKKGQVAEVGERVFHTRKLGKRYTAKLYQAVEEKKTADFGILMGVFCRG